MRLKVNNAAVSDSQTIKIVLVMPFVENLGVQTLIPAFLG